jgi:biopolymer transport protein ExbD
MKELILVFCTFFIVTTPVFAQDQPLPEKSSDSLQQEDSPTIEGLATSDHYPSCHRMKNWAAKQPLKTVSAE